MGYNTMGQAETLQCYTKFNTIYKDYKDCHNGAMVGYNTMHCNALQWGRLVLYNVIQNSTLYNAT